jgi:alkylation response protein AidB-like acyl-CoA dehydrogenase
MTATTPDRPEQLSPEALRQQQMKQAEELLFSGPQRAGFAKALFAGEFRGAALFPYPELPAGSQAQADRAVAAVRAFAEAEIDPVAIDREADIPRSVIDGLARLGVLGMTAPKEFGGRGFSQSQYCRVMEVLGGHDASTAVFVNAHHSIGIRALVLFGTPEQKARWLTPLVSGEKLAAFALTEEQAGSDAANVQTTATPSPDGSQFLLNGTKRYITNGAIADVLTVMARTPDPRGGDSKVTAFLVTPDMPGFEVVEARMPKCGIRGTATAKLAFHDMPVPAANILGPMGKGLRVALTVLDFGRTTFGASCTGAMKACLAASVRHALRRRQFGRPLAELELIQKKIGLIAAWTYAVEATTYETAALIDSGAEDYMLETAVLKVFATEVLWQAVYETLQVHGGQGYFTDEPYERWMRDARINTIGEGANEVLKAFIGLVGMRDTGEMLKATMEGVKSGVRTVPTLWRFASRRARRIVTPPVVPVVSASLRGEAEGLAGRVQRFGRLVENLLIHYREPLLEMQLIQERVADMAIALVTSACTLARLDAELARGGIPDTHLTAGRLYLSLAARTFDNRITELVDNDDRALLAAAAAALNG